MTYQIESHPDESVTLTAGSITAHIRGDGVSDAVAAAHVLGKAVSRSYEAAGVRVALDMMRFRLDDLDRLLDAAAHAMRDVGVLAVEAEK